MVGLSSAKVEVTGLVLPQANTRVCKCVCWGGDGNVCVYICFLITGFFIPT